MPSFTAFGDANGDASFRDCPLSDVLFPERLGVYGKPVRLGRGATSTVYEMVPPVRYVTKAIECGHDMAKLGNALHELRVMRRLDGCPHAVQLVDSEVVISGGRVTVYVVEERCTSLPETVHGQMYTVGTCLDVAIGLCDALIACRDAGVVHLDIKPRNVFVSDDGLVRLGDFGCASFVEELGDCDRLMGTLGFMAPEVFRELRYSERASVYSVGVLLYWLLNGGVYPFMPGCTASEAAYRLLAGSRLPILADMVPWLDEMIMPVIRDACSFECDARPETLEKLRSRIALLKNRVEKRRGIGNFIVGKADTTQLFSDSFDPAKTIIVPSVWPLEGPPRHPYPGGVVEHPPIWDDDTIGPDEWFPPETSPVSGGGGRLDRPAMYAPGNNYDVDSIAHSAMDDSRSSDSVPVSGDGTFPDRPATHAPGDGFDVDPTAYTVVGERCSSGSASDSGGGIRSDRPATHARREYYDADPIATSVFLSSSWDQPKAHHGIPVDSRREPSSTEKPTVAMSRARFSAVCPTEVARGEYATIDMVMYEEEFRSIVDQLKSESVTNVQEKQSLLSVSDGCLVRVVLSSSDAEICDDDQEYVWLGGFLSFSFVARIPSDLQREMVSFSAVVYVNGMLSTKLSFVVRCSAEKGQPVEIVRNDVHSAFISYASADRDRVISLIQGMRAARPDLEIFFDVQSLRAGEDWQRTIMNEVERRDVLYLCWSRSARASKYVDLEWRHAMQMKGIDFIEPVPLEPPTVCPPPDELKEKHFNDALLYLLESTTPTCIDDNDWL